MRVKYTLPWPPTVNTYWRHVGHKVLVSKQGREYQTAVAARVLQKGRVRFGDLAIRVQITARPPDRRRRDLDNLAKAVFDALCKAGVYDDDSQVQFFSVERGAAFPGGVVVVDIVDVEAST